MATNLLDYWNRALTMPYGLYVSVSDRVLFRQQLYRARDSAPNKEDYMGIAVMLPKAQKTHVWLVKKEHSEP